MTTSIQDVIDARTAYREKLQEVGREAVVDALKPLFAANPTIQYVTWTQYTPYFNDGEPCTFYSNHSYAGIFGSRDVLDESYYEDGDIEDAVLPQAFRDIPDDIMQACFGDHVQIIVSREGKVEVDEYNHD